MPTGNNSRYRILMPRVCIVLHTIIFIEASDQITYTNKIYHHNINHNPTRPEM